MYGNFSIRVVISCVLAGGAFYIIGIVVPLPEMKEFLTGVFRRRR